MEIIIEEINRGEKLLSRHRFLTDKVTIGRGYSNDIILADPHVCSEHLSLSFVGDHWLVTDQSSINGSFLENGKQNADQHVVRSGDTIRVGKSYIRLVLPEHPVEDTVLFSPFESIITLMRNPLMLGINILLFAVVAGMMFYLNLPKEVNFNQFVVRGVSVTLMFSLWPILIALVSHFNKHEARIVTQLAISFAMFNLMWVSDVLESIVAFNMSSNWSLASLITLLPIALAFILIWLNCYIGFHMSARRRNVIAFSITALLFGGSYMLELSKKPEFTARPSYDATIMTPTFRFSSSSSVDKFIHDSGKLFAKVEKSAQEKD